MTYTTTGIIINQRDWKDADRLFIVYTKDVGKTTLLARGVRKGKSKLCAKLQKYLELDLFLAKGRMFDIIAGVDVKTKILNLNDSLHSIGVVSLASEIMDNLLKDEEKDKYIYDLWLKFLLNINKIASQEDVNYKDFCHNQSRLILLLSSFIINFLSLLGYHLTLDSCANCNAKVEGSKVFFSHDAGGILCRNCYHVSKHGCYISHNTLNVINHMQTLGLGNVKISGQVNLNELLSAVLYYVRYRSDKEMKSERFLNVVLR